MSEDRRRGKGKMQINCRLMFWGNEIIVWARWGIKGENCMLEGGSKSQKLPKCNKIGRFLHFFLTGRQNFQRGWGGINPCALFTATTDCIRRQAMQGPNPAHAHLKLGTILFMFYCHQICIIIGYFDSKLPYRNLLCFFFLSEMTERYLGNYMMCQHERCILLTHS